MDLRGRAGGRGMGTPWVRAMGAGEGVLPVFRIVARTAPNSMVAFGNFCICAKNSMCCFIYSCPERCTFL